MLLNMHAIVVVLLPSDDEMQVKQTKGKMVIELRSGGHTKQLGVLELATAVFKKLRGLCRQLKWEGGESIVDELEVRVW